MKLKTMKLDTLKNQIVHNNYNVFFNVTLLIIVICYVYVLTSLKNKKATHKFEEAN